MPLFPSYNQGGGPSDTPYSKAMSNRGRGAGPRELTADEAALLRKLKTAGGVFARVASTILVGRASVAFQSLIIGDERLTDFLNQPLSNGSLPLYFALTPEGRAAATGLDDWEKTQFPAILLSYGADPSRKDSAGRIAYLAPEYPRNPLLPPPLHVKSHADGALVRNKDHGGLLRRQLTRDEKIWLVCAYAAFWDQQGVAKNLEAELFGGTLGAERIGTNRVELSDLLTKREALRKEEVYPFLTQLQSLIARGVVPSERVAALLNHSFDENGQLLAHRMVLEPDYLAETSALLIKLGARFDIHERTALRNTAFHWAALMRTIDILVQEGLCDKQSLKQVNTHGDTGLHLYLSEGGDDPTTLDGLADEEVVQLRNSAGEYPLDVALVSSPMSVPMLLKFCGYFNNEGEEEQALPVSNLETIRPWLALLSSSREFFEGRGPFVIPHGTTLPTELWGVVVAALSVSAYADGEENLEEKLARLSPDDAATDLARNLPTLLLHAPKEVMLKIAQIIDDKALENTDPEQAFHPNESELMAMLARHDLGEDEREKVVIALTSTRRFDLSGTETVSGSVVGLWSDIGKLGFEFLNAKWDARRFVTREGRVSTLLEEYGFQRVMEGGKLQHSFVLRGAERPGIFAIEQIKRPQGKTRRITNVDDGTEIELNRTHIRVFHPDYGEIVVRNSAPDGGRNKLAHPFYVIAPDVRTYKALESRGVERRWSFEEIETYFTEGLAVSLYPDGKLGEELQGAKFLLEQYRAVMRDYHASYFDLHELTAYYDDERGERHLVGAYKSPLFATLLEALQDWSMGAEALEIAACERNFPAWGQVARLDITEETVSQLEALARGNFDEEELQASGVLEFMKRAVFSFGDLIVRSR